MAELEKRQRRFPAINDDGTHNYQLLRGFHARQRKRIVLGVKAKPKHGVSQPMPPRKK